MMNKQFFFLKKKQLKIEEGTKNVRIIRRIHSLYHLQFLFFIFEIFLFIIFINCKCNWYVKTTILLFEVKKKFKILEGTKNVEMIRRM